MKLVLSYCKVFTKGLKLVLIALVLFPVLGKAQATKSKIKLPVNGPAKQAREFISPLASNSLRTTATATCPTSPVAMTGADATTFATINSGHTFACGANSFFIYPGTVLTGGLPAPCINTEFDAYHNQLGTNGIETVYEGGVPIYTLCAACAGGPIGGGTTLGGQIWNFNLYNLDPSQSHEFVFCRSGSLGAATTVTVSLTDCWTGLPLASTPTASIFSNATTAIGGTCDTLKLPVGAADLGTVSYSISPASGAPGLIPDGSAAYIYTDTLGLGTYTVTYNFTPPTADGCSTVTGTYVFTVGPPITVTVPSHTVCWGTSATLTATGHSGTAPYSFSWAPAAGLSVDTGNVVTDINPTTTTVYTITATDGGCSATTTSTVTVNTAATFSVNSVAICGAGANDTLTATGTAATYSWSPSTGLSATSGSTVTATPSVTTVYTVTGTNGVCSSTETSTVTISASPAITVNSATICAGSTTTLTANGATTYTWNPATGLSSSTGNIVTATPSVTTTYTVTGSAGSCAVTPATSTVTVAPSLSLTVNSAAICPADSATLTVSGATSYTWSPAAGLNTTTGGTVKASPSTNTTYTITANTGVCNGMDTAKVTLVPVPTFTVNKAIICSGNPATLIGSDNTLTYTWTPVATTTVSATTDTLWANPASTTVYTVTGANAGCSSLPVLDSVKVLISPTIVVLSPTVCVGTTATITATGATSYTWSPLTNLTSTITNDTVFINNPTAPASYTVMGTAANGCVSSAVSQVDTSNHLGILSGSPQSRCFGSYVGLTAIGASTYTWTSNDPTNLDFGTDTSWFVSASVANVGTYSIAIYGESHSGHYCNGRDTVILTINPTPTITTVLSPTTGICSGSTATITASGAATYTWISPSTTSVTPTPNTFLDAPTFSTTYTVNGSNAFGCTSSAITTISVTPVPSFTVSSPIICLGSSSDSLKVLPNTATSYSWSAGLSATTGTFVTFNANTAGTNTYSVFATETDYSISCSSSPVTVTVTVNPVPVITITVNPVSDTICAGNSATLTASGATTYTWTSLSTTSLTPTPNVFIDAPTITSTYTVAGTSLGCTSTTTANIVVNNVPTFSYTGVPALAICAGGTDTIEVTPTYTNAVNPSPTYSWTSPPNGGLSTNTGTVVNVSPTGTVSLTYTVTATSGSCQATNLVNLQINNPPVLIPTPDTTVCSGNPVTLNANPQGGGANNTYTWTPIGINTISTVVNPTATTSTTVNIYSVQATNTVTGCQSSIMTVTVNATLVPTVIASYNAPLCTGQAIDLTATVTGSPTNYIWIGPGTYTSSLANPVIPNGSPANSGTYTVTVSSGSCTATSNVLLTVNPPTALNVVSTNTVVCPNTPATYTATGTATSYTWSPSTGVTAVTPNASIVNIASASSNTYVVTGIDAATGCISTKTITLIVDPISASFVPSTYAGIAPLSVTFTNTSVSGTPTSSYTWNYGNDSTYVTNNVNDPTTHTTYTAGTYNVILTAGNSIGCTNTVSATIVVTESYTITIPNVFTPNGDNINEYFTIKAEGVSSISILIYDRWGLEMFESTSVTGAWDGKNMGGKEVPSGTYFYVINATDNKGKNNPYKGFITLIR